jgi:hypothetical protein
MDQLTDFDGKARAGEGQREALQWLARRLQWERRLGELRPGTTTDTHRKAA